MKLKETKTKKKYYKLKALFLVLYKQFFIFMMIFITKKKVLRIDFDFIFTF